MKAIFILNICFMSLFWRFKAAYAYCFVIYLYFSFPFRSFFVNASKAGSVVCSAPVLSIFCISRFAQITKTIIGSVSVYMIYLVCRPLSCHIKPRKTMCKMQNIVKPDANISITHSAASWCASSTPSPRKIPCKFAGILAIVNQNFQSILSKHDHLLNDNNYINKGAMVQA